MRDVYRKVTSKSLHEHLHKTVRAHADAVEASKTKARDHHAKVTKQKMANQTSGTENA